ncbi:lambda-exonuclease family protein [Vaccinium witches'-broom phytoplasma]|uniref:lambda-exonuclease family protein n=1 Tax=Vaccinium witches'-broom phytoplasma TaxID=85642 RepID=UPI000381AD55|nr:YqaJ viral recombinase family protein [Vaccinium witches'-broom phytoplasma]
MKKNIFAIPAIKVALNQNSYEWFRHRKKFINASEVGTIMGLNPYETKEDLLFKKVFGSDFITNEAVEHGKITEPKARNFYCFCHGLKYVPAVFTRGLMSASLDGYNEETKTLLEIKCPLNPDGPSWQVFFKTKEIPPYYWAQIQAQLYCSGLEKGYFFVFVNDKLFRTQEVFLDKSFIAKMFMEAEAFQQELDKSRKMVDLARLAENKKN